jgi:uncharacterized membrane protein
MPAYAIAFLMGAVAGLRSMTAPGAVSWAARSGRLHLADTPLAFFGLAATPYVLSVLAIVELVNDKLPRTSSRKAPVPFAARIVMGALCGWALAGHESPAGTAATGALGAVAGTVGGYEFRTRLVKATGGKDLPIALLEDAVAIGAAFGVVSMI